jgi:hypothetical protein
MKHVIDLQVDNDVDSREINALTKAKGCNHPSILGGTAIMPGLKSLFLLLHIHTLVQCVIEFAGVIQYVEGLRKFLDEVDPCTIDDVTVISIEHSGSENVGEPLDDFFP